MPKLTTADWWTRRICRWIDVARREARKGLGRRYKPPSDRQFVAIRYNQLQAKQRDLLTLDYRRRSPR
jgi:hypothetical protein